MSYDAEMTMVVSHRGIGKTYGLRKQMVKDYLKHGYRFAAISRYKNRMKKLTKGYFEKVLRQEYPSYESKIEGDRCFIRKRSIGDDTPNKWELIGYFVALTDYQSLKELTFTNVKRLCFDEAVIDRENDRFHSYLINEEDILGNVVDSVTRQVAGDGTKPRLYLLGNAVDILCPYFDMCGVTDIPKEGYKTSKKGRILFHNYVNKEFAERKRNETLAGLLLSDNAAKANVYNEFVVKQPIFKPVIHPVFVRGFLYKDLTVGIWCNQGDTYNFYVRTSVPKESPYVHSLDYRDAGNMVIAGRRDKALQSLFIRFQEGRVFATDIQSWRALERLFTLCGFIGL